MKTTKELIEAFGKGQKQFKISSKQAKWLFSLAKQEGILTDEIETKWIKLDGIEYQVRALKIATAAYGGYVGSKGKSGNWIVSTHYRVRFKDTGIVQIVDNLKQIKNYNYEII
ncbi:MAG: hypothetical protein ACLFUH_01845 [Bacteroidales bacterium]